MAIPLTGTGGVFTALGKVCGWIISELNRQGAAALTAPVKSAGSAFSDLNTQYSSSVALANIFDGTTKNILNPYRAKSATIPQLVTLAQELNRQMGIATTKYVAGATITAVAPTTGAGNTNTGTAIFTSSVTGPYLMGSVTGAGAMVLQYIFPEIFVLKCTSDSYTGNAPQYQEQFSYQAPPNTVSDPMLPGFTAAYSGSPSVPVANLFGLISANGSNGTGTINICSPAIYQNAGPGGNILNNGDFANWSSALSSATLNHFVAVLGAAGTDYEISTAIGSPTGGLVASTAIALLFGGGGATFTQQFGNGAGTNVALLPNTVYAGNIWAKKVASGTGNVIIDLIDGSNNVIADNNAVNNSLTFTVASLSTSYAAQPFYFRTPAVVPATHKIRIRYTSPGTANAFISDLSLRVAPQLYTGGGYLAGFRGATPSVAGDDYNAQFTNDFGAITNSTIFSTIFNWLFGLRTLQAPPPISNTQPPAGSQGFWQLPIVGTTQIVDTLIS